MTGIHKIEKTLSGITSSVYVLRAILVERSTMIPKLLEEKAQVELRTLNSLCGKKTE